MQLQSKRMVKGKEISKRFGISLRTVYRDIRALEDAGVPIGSEAGVGYFLAEGYHLPPVMFTIEEAGSLLMGSKLIEQYSDLSVNRTYATALDKIKAVMDKPEKDHLNTLSSYIEVLKTAPKNKTGLPNDVLVDIQAVLGQKRLIRIKYTSGYKDETTTRQIEPLGLCFYAGAWHLLAYCRMRDDYRDFRVDRIQHLSVMKANFNDRRHGTLKSLIDRIVHYSDVKPACVRFDEKAARYARDQKYYFGFVEQKKCGDQVEMHFLTASYEYFSRWLLSFVDAVTVVSPESLKEILNKHVQRLSNHHLR